jgi:hypothetical protein
MKVTVAVASTRSTVGCGVRHNLVQALPQQHLAGVDVDIRRLAQPPPLG